MKKNVLVTELLVYIVLLVILITAIIVNGPIVQMRFGHDVSYIIDGVWRIEKGQIPHENFSSVPGCGYLFQQYIFLKLFNYNLIGFTISSVTLTIISVTVFFSLFYSSDTFSQGNNKYLRIYTFLLIIAVGLGQYHLGEGFKAVTYANLYNRYCFLILLICFLIFNYLTEINTIGVKNHVYFLLVGLLLNYLFFSKFTYFLVAGAILTLYLITKNIAFKKYLYTIIYSIVVFILITLIFKINAISMLKDYESVSNVRTNSLFSLSFIHAKFGHIFNVVIVLSYCFLFYQLFTKKVNIRFLIIYLAVGFFSVALHFTNYGNNDIVLLMFVPVFFVGKALSEIKTMISFKVYVCVCTFFIAENLCSILYATTITKSSGTEIHNSYITGFFVQQADGYCNTNYADKFDSGTQMINKIKEPNDKIFTFSFENLFPVLTHTMPPKDDLLTWQYKMTFSEQYYPQPVKIFKDVTLIMIPKCQDPESSLYMKSLYRSYVLKNFNKIDEDNYWILYRKRLGNNLL